ncbi:MAG: alpha/beta hydrolase [Deltaproteobacteria bacterium]|nr:alpha/beta hydrolase [Deltaproteobacteria bacterium]
MQATRIASRIGAEVTYRLFDDGGRSETLLCNGGLGGTHLVWSGLTRLLRDRYRILIWDYPGLAAGESLSPGIALDVEGLARTSQDVLDAAGAREAVIVGWSLGVQVAFELARSSPDRVRAVVAMCGTADSPFTDDPDCATIASALGLCGALPGAVGWMTGRAGMFEAVRSMLRRVEHPTRWAKRLDLVDPSIDELTFDAAIRDYLALDPQTFLRYVEAAAVHDATATLGRISLPVLALAGERDRFVRPGRVRAMTGRIPEAELLEVRGATHYLPFEYPELVALTVGDFLARRLG